MKKKILVVEDTTDTREFMKFLLEMDGYFVIEAVNGMDAVETVKRQSPDLVLMDVSMPQMDGLTATRLIRKSGVNANVPIIAVTAHGEALYNRAIEAGCNTLIPKPIDLDVKVRM